MGAVTLLAPGNGVCVGGRHWRWLGENWVWSNLLAVTFVSALVVGFEAIYAASFSVLPAPFVRDVLFYLIAALFLFSVYLTAEIFPWQAAGFVGFYMFFVGIVFWMDLGMDSGKGKVVVVVVVVNWVLFGMLLFTRVRWKMMLKMDNTRGIPKEGKGVLGLGKLLNRYFLDNIIVGL